MPSKQYDEFLSSLTREERDAHELSMEAFDADTSMWLGDYMGPYGREALDADKMNVREIVNRKDLEWFIKGFYIPDDFYMDKGYYDYIKWKTGEPVKADEVNVIGAENASEQMWGHEFRHRYVEKERDEKGRQNEFLRDKFTRELKPDEKINLLWDAYRADSKEDWGNVVRYWRSDLMTNEPKRGRFDEAKAEEDLIRVLDKHKEDMIDQEALTQWQPPLELEDQRRLYRKGYERRSKSRNE